MPGRNSLACSGHVSSRSSWYERRSARRCGERRFQGRHKNLIFRIFPPDELYRVGIDSAMRRKCCPVVVVLFERQLDARFPFTTDHVTPRLALPTIWHTAIAWPCADPSRTVPPSEFSARPADVPLDIGAVRVQKKGRSVSLTASGRGVGPMIKIGICGFGYWGPNLLRNFATNPGFCPVAVAERREAYRTNAATLAPNLRLYEEAVDLIDDPEIEAVAIATPVSNHFELARRALTRFKHVLVEKPMCAGVAEGEELVALAERTRRTL